MGEFEDLGYRPKNITEFFFADKNTGQMPSELNIENIKALYDDYNQILEDLRRFITNSYIHSYVSVP